MPIYPYVCTACGHEFDTLQKISDDPLTDCPGCGEPSLRKRLAAPAFQLKGTGWYETDFKNSGKKKQEDKSGKPGKGEAAGKDGDSGQGKDTGGAKSDGETARSGGSAGQKDARPAAAAGGKDD